MGKVRFWAIYELKLESNTFKFIRTYVLKLKCVYIKTSLISDQVLQDFLLLLYLNPPILGPALLHRLR